MDALRRRLQRSEKISIIAVLLLLVGACAIDYHVGGDIALYATSAVIAVIFVLVIYDRRRIPEETHQRLKNESAQLESLMSLHFSLQSDTPPLPDTRGWAASPDFLKLTASLIHQEQPNLIVEAGSGVSTIVCGRILRRRSGRVTSLEHERTYKEKNSRLVEGHGLSETCNVRHTPLVSQKINGEMWQWYDLDRLRFDYPIDFLLIDGPPTDVQGLSRYPALPLLFEKMGENAFIVLDDGDRDEESQIVQRWTTEYPSLSATYHPLEKGAFVLRREDE